tara:strand:- start:3381 stop:4352 length:972 start_codon:yes stop_codon:yes gene_type:complete
MSIEGEVSTDQEILNNIGEGADDDQGQEDSQESQEATTEQAPEADSGQVADSSTTENTQGQQQDSSPSNLVNARGEVVAKGGMERRFYDKAVKSDRDARNAQQQVETLQGQLSALQGMGNLSTQYGITPEEVSTGAQLMKSFNDNPVDTVKYLLTQAQSMGHNVDGIGGSTDMSAIKQMMSEMMAPITNEHQQRAEDQQIEAETQTIYNDFMTQFPDAEVHQDSLAQLIQNDQSLSPVAAYYKLQAFYGQKGLDWTKPLDVLKNEIANRPAINQVPNVPSQGTVPSGGNVPQQNVIDTADIADVGVSSDDIIRQSMIDAGYSI